MLRRTALLTVVFSLVIWGVALAQDATPPLTVKLSRAETGWVAAHVTGPAGATVALSEEVAGATAPVATVALPASGVADAARAVPWRCDRPVRHLTATVTLPDGTTRSASDELRTPSCRNRLALGLRPSSPRVRRVATVQVSDRWRLGGVKARVCISEPGGVRRKCRAVVLGSGEFRAGVRLQPRRTGRWAVTLREPDGRSVHRTLLVRPASPRLRVLATGDSMIQIIDGFLKQRLSTRGPISVHSDAHISTGISKPFMLNWVAHARGSAGSVRPDVTVMFLGANDGFPMKTGSGVNAPCCNDAWVSEYAHRARAMMRAYARRGAGTVYWMLLPVPRSKNFQMVFRPVNRALRAAARSFPGVVHLINLGATFTPHGKFRQTMRWQGKTVSVRQADGVHLSVAGASIATTLLLRQMRRDGLIR